MSMKEIDNAYIKKANAKRVSVCTKQYNKYIEHLAIKIFEKAIMRTFYFENILKTEGVSI